MNTHEATKTILKAMLTESTGSNLIDSGMIDRRHWQLNRHRDFDAENPATVSFSSHYIDYTMRLYPYLCDTLTYDKAMDRRFHLWSLMDDSGKDRYSRRSWCEQMHEWANKMVARDTGEPYLPSKACVSVEYTYNYETFLDQDFQFVEFDYNGTTYVILQIHGGCDARWGFTTPHVFAVNEDYWNMWNEGYLACTNEHCRAAWDRFDGIWEPQQRGVQPLCDGVWEPKEQGYPWVAWEDCLKDGEHWYVRHLELPPETIV